MSQVPIQFPDRVTFTDQPVYRLTVEQYHSLIEQGSLTTDDPIELLDGILVYKMSKNPPHRIAMEKLRRAIEKLLPSGWSVMAQEPITLATSEPEPDLSVIRGEVDDYPDRHPGVGEIELVVEVADSTLIRDRGIKAKIYAQAGLREYWLVNLIDRTIEVYRLDASNSIYQAPIIYPADSELELFVTGKRVGTISAGPIFPR